MHVEKPNQYSVHTKNAKNFLSKAFAVILEYLRTGNWWFAGMPKRQVFDEARFFKIRKRVLVVTADFKDDYNPGQRVKLG